MNRSFTGFVLVLVLVLTLAIGWPVLAAAAAGEVADVDAATKARVLGAIESYVREDVALKETFLVLDPRSGVPLSLSFDHVHSGVHPHEKGYRACVDFTDEAGTIYDLDVVVEVAGDKESVVRAVWVHKVGGEAAAPSN